MNIFLCLLLLPLFCWAVPDNNAASFHAQKALRYTNEFRYKKEKSPFIWHQELADIAWQHSYNMAHGIVPFGHAHFKERMATCSWHVIAAAENVYMCNYTDDIAWRAVDGWIHSPGHCRNLLGEYAMCGIGAYCNQAGYWYVTQIVSTSREIPGC